MTTIFTPEKITNHEDQALDRLANEFKAKPRIEAMIRAFTGNFQDLEDSGHKFFSAFIIKSAVGNQLDLIGNIVGVSRSGRSDSEYRIAIYAKIAINIAKGIPEDIIEVYRLITGATSVHLQEYYPGVVEIYGNVNIEYYFINDGADAFAFEGGVDGLGFGDFFDPSVGGIFAELVLYDIAYLYRIMDSVLAGGVRLDRLGYYSDTPFSFEGDPNGLGFGDVFDSTVGGEFATIVLPS